MRKEIEPFDEGWENLSLTQRLNIWLKRNPLPEEAKLTIENFVISCDQVSAGDYWNFRNLDIRYFPQDVQETLIEGFFAVYNTSETLLALREYEPINPELN